MSTMVSTLEEFIQLLTDTIDALTSHSFTAKDQSKYLSERKEELQADSAIVILDFAENYEYTIQHEVQSYHWSKERCTLHPVSIYVKEGDEVTTKSLCIMSDDLEHDTCFVHEVMRVITDYLKLNHPNVKSVQYFSDGCAGQYKNYKNFMNLCLHEQELGMPATWSFFATSHGKGPCDGIGGTVKRLARHESLRREKDFLNTFEKLYKYCEDEIKGVEFFRISADQMDQRRPVINKRFEGGSTVSGTQSYHHFVPVDPDTIAFKRLSKDVDFCGKQKFSSITPLMNNKIGDYVSVAYDREWYIGAVEHFDAVNNEYKINFMHPKMNHKSLYWPPRQDKCLCPASDILTTVDVPTFTSPRARTYKLKDEEFKEIEQKFINYIHTLS